MSSEREELYRALIESIGEDTNREGLLKTPARAAKAFGFLTQGYEQSLETILNEAVFQTEYDDMVIVRDIEFYSLCEHHLLPFFGKAHIAYIPDGKILGLSKFARVTDMFGMFFQATAFNQTLPWNSSRVTYMYAMFAGAASFNADISKWNTSAVVNMNSMFYYASSFNADISNWDTSRVTDMSNMFKIGRAHV